MKKNLASLILLICTATVFAQNVKPYTVDLNRFEDANDGKTATFNKKTKTVTVNAPSDTSLYAWLDLNISDYNIIRIKYKVLGDYGFHLIIDYADERYAWDQKNYCPSNLTEMVFPLIEGQKKLNGISLQGPYHINHTKFIVDSIIFEKISNPVKTDIYANINNETVIDTATNGTIDAKLSAWDYVKTMGPGFQYSPFILWPQGIEYGMDFYHPGMVSKPSKEMIQFIKEKGFKTVRLQTNPGIGMMMDKDYTINPGYLKAIKEVVDWCMEEDMNVIICGPFTELTQNEVFLEEIKKGNIRYAGYYVNEKYEKESKKFIEAIWRQYAQAFNNSYDEHLVFETFNEPFDVFHEHGWGPKSDCAVCKKDFALLNEYNQLIVDTVRSTGGNNANRLILVESLAGGWENLTNKLFKLPKDKSKNKLIGTFHFYQMGTTPQMSSKYYTKSIKNKALEMFSALDKAYFSKKIPIYITEMGSTRAIPILERINCMKDFMAEVTKSNRSCGTILHSDFDLNGADWFHCYYDSWNLKWFDDVFIDTYIYGANGKELKLSDDFIKENDVRSASIVGKNLLTEPVEIKNWKKSYTIESIHSSLAKYKLEFEIETTGSDALMQVSYNDLNQKWSEVVQQKNVKIQGGTLKDGWCIEIKKSGTVSLTIDEKLAAVLDDIDGIFINGQNIIIKSLKVVE